MGNFLSLVCPSCGAQIRASEKDSRYKCEYCGTEHLIRLEAGQRLAEQPEIRERMPVARPGSVQVHNDGRSARIVRRWFSGKYVALAFFCVAWDGFLCFWYGMAFLAQDLPWSAILFPTMHVAAGVAMTYWTLAGFLNRTTLEIEREDISLWHGPLPWYGGKDLKTADVKQFYTTEKIKTSDNGGYKMYDLHVVMKSGESMKLLGNLDDPQVALFFEQQLEAWLGIEDVPVRGELDR